MSALSPSPYRRLSQAASPILTPKKGDPTPTVFVKLTGDDEYIPKKILIPRKISQLLENCIKILQDPNLKSVLDDRGFLIESCRDIEPGSVLTITPIDPAFCPRDPKRKIRSPDIAKNVSTPKEDDENAEANAALQEKKRKEAEEHAKEDGEQGVRVVFGGLCFPEGVRAGYRCLFFFHRAIAVKVRQNSRDVAMMGQRRLRAVAGCCAGTGRADFLLSLGR